MPMQPKNRGFIVWAAAFCIFASISAAHAQGIPIGALPNATLPLSGSEYTILSQNGLTVKATLNNTIAPGITIANNTLLGNISGTTAAAVALTPAQVRTLLGLGTAALANTGTSGHTLPYLDTSNTWAGLQTFSGGATITGSLTLTGLTVNGATALNGTTTQTGALNLSGTTSPLQFNGSAGTSGNPMISQGAGATPSFGTRSGNTTVFGTTTGTLTSGHIATFDASGNIIDGGAPSSGTVNSGTINQAAYYAAAGTTISGTSAITMTGTTVTISPSSTVAISPTGALTVNPTAASTINNTSIGVTTAAAGRFTTLTTTGAATLSPANANDVLSPTGTGTVTISPATAGTMNNMAIGGTTAAAGTFTSVASSTGISHTGTTSPLTLNGSAGTAGQVATSAGPGATPTWGSAGLAAISVQATSFAATANSAYCVNTTGGAVTMTLPAAPANNDQIRFIDCNSNFNNINLIVARNGKTIMGLAQDMTVNISNAASTLIYVSANSDWRMY